MTVTRPRGSSGRSVPRSIGLAMTPAVQTMRSDSKVSPVESSILPSTALASCVSRWISASRCARFLMTHWLVLSETSGMMRPIASMRWNCTSSVLSCGYWPISALAKLRSSPKTSMPAKPPPTTTKVSSRSRSGPAGRLAALAKLSVTRSRIAVASSIVLRPIASSATPGIGKVRETAPAVTTSVS